jgi:hypothetical protein
VQAPSEDKSDDSKDSFYEELELGFYRFPKYRMKILLDFNAKVGGENIFKPTNGIESLHQDSNDNGVRIVNVATSKNLVLRARFSRTETFISTRGPLLMDRLITRLITLIDRRLHSSILDVRSFRGADCETDQYLVVAKVRERLAARKQAAQKFDKEIFNMRKLNVLEVWKLYQIDITNRFAALEKLSDD